MNIRDYIHGKRHGKEANRLEREAMKDPFLQNAIDGFDSVPGNHVVAIEKLEKQLAAPAKRIDKRVWMWAAAAVLVLLIGIPVLLRKPDIQKEVMVASSDKIEPEETAASLQKDSILITESFDVKKKETPQPKAPQPIVQQNEPEILMEVQPTPISAEAVTPPKERMAAISNLQDKKAPEKEFRIRGVSSPAASDKRLVHGRIIDENNEPIIGATIHIKNTELATVSDTDGNFAFIAPKDEKGTLVASFIGMENKEIPLKDEIGDIVMKEDAELLSEVVVISYGTKRKKTYTGAVSNAKDTIPVFGETEFQEYFEENYDKTLCAKELISIKVEFYVNAQGQPGSIVVKENSCPALATEIKRLLLGL